MSLEVEEVEIKPVDVTAPINRRLLKCSCGSNVFKVRIEMQKAPTQTRRWMYLLCPDCHNEYRVDLPYRFIDRHFE